MGKLPSIQTLYNVTDHTWPAAKVTVCGLFTLRQGKGGGSRVNAAVATGPITKPDIDTAANTMRRMGQPVLFMVREGEGTLDTMLAAMGYDVKDPVSLYAGPIAGMTVKRPPHKTVFPTWPPLAVQSEIWMDGGIDAGRFAVMDRAVAPKTTLLGRVNDQPAGTCYVAISQGCAMIHALEIESAFRRRGLARHMTVAAAFWARDNGADFLALATTQANAGANALYTSLGMTVVGHYHYRILPE